MWFRKPEFASATLSTGKENGRRGMPEREGRVRRRKSRIGENASAPLPAPKNSTRKRNRERGSHWLLTDDPKFNVRPLAERTEDEIDQTLRNFDITYKRLRKAIWEARQSHSDKVTLFPPKPWAKS